MRAAADCAEDDRAPIPPELTLAWNIERWGAPAVLGNNPIPVRLIRRMNAASNVYRAMKSYQAGASRLADWARANPDQAALITMIRNMRTQDA